MDDEKQREKEIEKEKDAQAAQNTAHVAGRAASRYFGGEVGGKLYDVASNTKLGQGIERAAGRVITNNRTTNKLNRALNDSGAVDMANQAVDTMGGKGAPGDGSEALKSNQSNKGKFFSSIGKKKNSNASETTGDVSSDNVQNDGYIDDIGGSKEKKSSFNFIPIIIIAVVVPFVLVVLGILSMFNSFTSIFSIFGIANGSINGSLVSNSDLSVNEKKYYEKLDSVIAKYRNKCGISLNRNYINSVLLYNHADFDEMFGEDSESYDYASLTGNIETVADLLVSNCSVDYEVGGASYNQLKNSKFFKNYFKEELKTTDSDSILQDIFSIAEISTNIFGNSVFINDNLKVTLATCNTGQYLNGTKENSTIGFSEYIMGVVYGELDTNLEIIPSNKEFLKAQVVAATSYVLSRTKYHPGDTEIWVQNGDCWQVSCDINQGCTYAYDLGQFGTTYTGNVNKDKTDWKRNPIPDSKLALLQEVMNEVFGTVMLNPDGSFKWSEYRDKSCGTDCMGQKPGIVDAQNGMTYKEILEKYYDNFTLSDASEDLYAPNVTYEDGGYNSSVVYYNQNDYHNKFCGRTDGTIATSGCGVTSMAIVLSTLIDDKFTPPVVMEEAYNFGSCGRGISGTATNFFKKSANLHDLGYKKVSKSGNLQAVLNALKTGKSLVVAHMGPSTFTRSGHYIVLARVNSKGQVYVYDPNKSSRNGWYDFNSVIVKESRGSFHIITKR